MVTRINEVNVFKMNKCTILFLSISLFGFVSYAQSSIDENQITANVEKLYEAMVSKDKTTLENLTAEKLTYGHSSGTLENKHQYVEAIMTGSFDFIIIKPVDQNIEISGYTAIVRHIFEAKGVNDGTDTDVRIGILMAWQKQEGNWLLLARQAYKL